VVPAASARTPPVPSPAPKPAHPDPPPPPPPTEVRVRIVSHPADATVVLDGKKLGRTPFDDTLKADPGKHVVKLRRRGYATYKLDLELGADVTEDVTLVPGK